MKRPRFLRSPPYLDCDTSPPLRGRYATRVKAESFKAEALRLIAAIDQGQIGIYETVRGGTFYGYAIKYPGQKPYFEEPEAIA